MTTVGLSGRAVLLWRRAKASLWLNPALFVVLALVLSTVLLEIDRALGRTEAEGLWLFGGNAAGARTTLSVIAGSLITVVAVAFSVTIIAIQQASTQFTPRVLRNFTRDRGNQLVLATYIGTFTYALLVLRRVREAGLAGPAFVPAISISVAILLSVISLGMLVYFIHHAAESLQVSYLLSSIRRELDEEIDKQFPDSEEEGDPAVRFAEPFDARLEANPLEVTSEREGYLVRVDLSGLAMAAASRFRTLHVEVQIGDYVRPGDVLFRAPDEGRADDDFLERARAAFQLDRDRSVEQDPLFGIRQITDIAIKALSPGINDPTTAEQALDFLGGAVNHLLDRAIPSPRRVTREGVRLVLRSPSFAEFVDACFCQIRSAARRDLQVSLRLISVLRGLLQRTTSESRARHLRRRIDEVRAGFDWEQLTADGRASLRLAG